MAADRELPSGTVTLLFTDAATAATAAYEGAQLQDEAGPAALAYIRAARSLSAS